MRTPRTIAVVAHQRKTLGGGLDELRTRITDQGVDKLLWYEVPKSGKAPKKVAKAIKAGVDLIIVWGGDGIVQRSIDVLAGADSAIPLAILPAGTGNLLAGNLGIEHDLAAAVEVAFHGRRKRLDVGKINGEHFAVMAGVGFDGAMIRDADRKMKDRLGKLGDVWARPPPGNGGAAPPPLPPDGPKMVRHQARFGLVGNVPPINRGRPAVDHAQPG